jgi:16S rRNA (guanine966-N2)-methyltransferase
MSRPRGLRVIAGSARGRKLASPAGEAVRPTKDIVREAMFSALDARGAIVDAVVLDLFAGSGALGIEALSRGAATAVLVEQNREALASIRLNLDVLSFVDRARVAPTDVSRFLRAPVPAEAPFDLVFVDPPYDTPDEQVTATLAMLCTPEWLAPDGIVTVERSVHTPVVVPDGLTNGWNRTFGDTLLTFCFR